ncbi:isochorismatase family protein [bacterium]|nr:isochorismatase family protein [candidate division CSSED10-310 bacterium]
MQLCRRYARCLLDKPDPRSITLLVIDMQNQFKRLWTGVDNKHDFLRFQGLIKTCRDAGTTIVRTQHGHENPKLDGGMLHAWWNSSIIVNSQNHSFIKGFEPEESDYIVPKNRYDAFQNTEMDKYLSNIGTTVVIIGGVMTNLCCETTARAAFCRDYRVIFLADGTATACEEMQRAALLNLSFGFAHVMSCCQTALWLTGKSIEKD